MKTSSRRILFVALSMALIVAAAVVYSSFISPAYENVTALRGQIASQDAVTQRFQITFSQVQKLLTDLQTAPDVQKQVSWILPTSRDASYLVGQISGLAEANGLTLSLLSTQVLPVQPAQSNVIQSIGKLRADVKLNGSYAGFKSFLRQLQSNMLLLDVTDIKIDSSSANGTATGKTGPTTLSYSISVNSYYQTSQ
jgi:Tfp pilus assembly protein PilO